MMRIRRSAGGVAAVLLALTACGTAPDKPLSSEPTARDPAAEEQGTKGPVEPPASGDAGARFGPALFGSDSATIDNPWWPHTPGTRFVYEGQALDENESIDRRIVSTVTDLTKEIAGVRALLVWEQDFDDDVMVEAELSFRAQDARGNVWHLGEYTEVYEDEEYIGNRVWVPGDPEGAQAGLLMPADPKPGDPSFSEGYAPPPWNWDDRGRVRERADEVCVEAGCYQDVLVFEEFEPSIRNAFQLKYYAREVGHVQVGWDGENETEQEELELVDMVELTPAELDEARGEALAMEGRAQAYARLGPAQPVGEGK
jgi:hypothetical protein